MCSYWRSRLGLHVFCGISRTSVKTRSPAVGGASRCQCLCPLPIGHRVAEVVAGVPDLVGEAVVTVRRALPLLGLVACAVHPAIGVVAEVARLAPKLIARVADLISDAVAV